MTILLPNNRYSGVDILANNLTPQRLQNLFLNDMYPREVKVSLPKFKMEDSFELRLFSKNGAKNLFDRRELIYLVHRTREFPVDAVIHRVL
ncbi:hypothetical protein JTE90_001292 [Oedothorax gibbosus]|uniref:Serpin domain-containing protein n=1 Tax=Oedothorax gibbosus TaxID=931172 RepID=A0AAV6V2E5_9ARAC|nr:hypothetical protein JTE90_001292 [Oedothorax gibbosus]